MRPSARAVEDEKRVKAAKEKREGLPGPGAYDPRVTEHGSSLSVESLSKDTFNTSAKAGKIQFGVNDDARGVQIATDKNNLTVASGWQTPGMGDANLYNPNHNREVGHEAKKTFRTQSKAGKAGFAGSEKRTLLLSNVKTKTPTQGWTGPIEDTPGPVAYVPKVDEYGREQDMHTMSEGEKMKSAAFASATIRPGPEMNNKFVPGPGSYEPNDTLTTNSLPGANMQRNTISKTGRDHKFVSDNLDGVGNDSSTAAHVGPGSYNSHVHNSMAQSQDKVKDAQLLDASFMSDTFRTIYTGQED